MPADAHLTPLGNETFSRRSRWLAIAGLLSAGVIVFAAFYSSPGVATAGAAAFVLVVSVIASTVARSWIFQQGSGVHGLPSLLPARQSARLAFTVYLWGAAAMQGAYLAPLTGLRWQHGWQYACAMLLLAAGSLVFARAIDHVVQGDELPAASGLAKLANNLGAAQALIAGGGLAALVISGKLFSVRADWAANRVFAGLAVAIFVISASYLISAPGRRRRV